MPRPDTGGGTIVLDLDHTMVGDVTPLLHRYAVLRAVRKLGLPGPCPDAALVDVLSTTPLLRPGLTEFLRRSVASGKKLYVFTASERAWATALVRAIQRVTGVRFARPLFARDNCHVRGDGSGMLGKSLTRLGPRRLVGAHPPVVIDNAAVWEDVASLGARFVMCPTYRYAPFVDVLEGIPASTLRDPRLSALVSDLVASGGCYDPTRYRDAVKSACARHRFLAAAALRTLRQNEGTVKDAFFHGVA